MEHDSEGEDRLIRHLNTSGLVIRDTGNKGRGVFATTSIPAGVLVDISPVMLFTPEEYVHAKLTIIDHYSYVWNDAGKSLMALPLGLGSIFNHSRSPNVSYRLNKHLNVIEYTTTKPILPEEEICIYYGSDDKLWFHLEDGIPAESNPSHQEDFCNGILPLSANQSEAEDAGESASSEDLLTASRSGREDGEPVFRRIKVLSAEEREEAVDVPVPTIDVWVVDVEIPSILKMLMELIRKSGFDSDGLKHLKRVRTSNGRKSIVLADTTTPAEHLPTLPGGTSQPYVTKVPKRIATSQSQLSRKNPIWPVGLNPYLAPPERVWTQDEINWMSRGIEKAVEVAIDAKNSGELPIGVHVSPSLGETGPSATTHDTRTSSGHPLRHAAQIAVRRIAEIRAGLDTGSYESTEEPRNGASYLLTGLTLFMTHEPCIMCSMSLLHSRVARVVYIHRMVQTGGCNEVGVCLPALNGINHRFEIIQWYGSRDSDFDHLKLPEEMDV